MVGKYSTSDLPHKSFIFESEYNCCVVCLFFHSVVLIQSVFETTLETCLAFFSEHLDSECYQLFPEDVLWAHSGGRHSQLPEQLPVALPVRHQHGGGCLRSLRPTERGPRPSLHYRLRIGLDTNLLLYPLTVDLIKIWSPVVACFFSFGFLGVRAVQSIDVLPRRWSDRWCKGVSHTLHVFSGYRDLLSGKWLSMLLSNGTFNQAFSVIIQHWWVASSLWITVPFNCADGGQVCLLRL